MTASTITSHDLNRLRLSNAIESLRLIQSTNHGTKHSNADCSRSIEQALTHLLYVEALFFEGLRHGF